MSLEIGTGRKPRIVRDALIDIHDVSVESGHKYCNWIQIVHIKLGQRERQLFTQKCDKIISITNQVYVMYIFDNKKNENLRNTNMNHRYSENVKLIQILN